jgi:hypothetical protein
VQIQLADQNGLVSNNNDVEEFRIGSNGCWVVHCLVKVRHLARKQQKYKAKGIEGYLVCDAVEKSSLEP